MEKSNPVLPELRPLPICRASPTTTDEIAARGGEDLQKTPMVPKRHLAL
jgi:hypothetical protein